MTVFQLLPLLLKLHEKQQMFQLEERWKSWEATLLKWPVPTLLPVMEKLKPKLKHQWSPHAKLSELGLLIKMAMIVKMMRYSHYHHFCQ
ncbi:MAG: hypothetical protein A2887_02995 [Alphaproteobacteria bacterium RIFCSPLOWO2_01_FULL_40_26]|nr:MAG: hypothetical protein A3D15_05585 [Alphaproteobacteria bacterium RIFCSPHIGHO2_02_FULL_40_34]OFW95491.1 MAG: hypothetical protein A2887_02995 [Alphaproteobacteria bacterium RIFCSPLOWO2_01_FULL_40_26]OFX09329.1 MAG: hypothetical protein A3H30_01335 [Alphaproteobacteria bacterium RIFCSPLOWO2_02_FULL_40_19]